MSTHAPVSDDQEQFDPEATTQVQPNKEEIARLAYQYWLDRGSPDGTPDEDWFRAEEEVRSREQQ
jgi:hypothetical protein